MRRIFQEYAAGKPPERIARDLNGEGIKGPFGREWSNTTIRGQTRRGNGILNNETYVGKISWNRCSYVKDPSTGKRVARPNPKGKWEVVAVPELRIVDDELWDDVKRRQFNIRNSLRGQSGLRAGMASRNLNATHRPRFLLSGLVRCAACGGNFVMSAKEYLACSNRRRKGTCSCNITVKRLQLESRVLEGLKERLITPELVETFVREFQQEHARLLANQAANRRVSTKKLADIDRKIKAMMTAIEDGFYAPEMKDRLAVLTSEKAALSAHITGEDHQDKVVIHPRLHELYKRKIAALQDMLEGENADAARDMIRSMIEKVMIAPASNPSGYVAELYGELAAILAVSQETGEQKSPKSQLPGIGIPGSQLSVVAGARFELTTFRL